MCGLCKNRFERQRHKRLANQGKRFRECLNCAGNPDMGPAEVIITRKSSRVHQRERAMAHHMVSKKSRFNKTIPPQVLDDNLGVPAKRRKMTNKKTIWNRDLSAARLILYKGRFN